MEECIGQIENLYNGKITLELLDPSTKVVSQKVEVDNAVMDYTIEQWKQMQKANWMLSLPDGRGGGFLPLPLSGFNNSEIILTTDSSTPDSTNASINGRVLAYSTKFGNSGNASTNLVPRLCERTRDRARYVFEWGPLEANGTFQSVCWGRAGGNSLNTLNYAGAFADHSLKIVDEIGKTSGAYATYDGSQYIYHWYLEGDNVASQLWLAKTDIYTKIKTNIFAVPNYFKSWSNNYSYLNSRIILAGNYYMFYGNSSSNSSDIHIYNQAGEALTRTGSGTVQSPYVYTFVAGATTTVWSPSIAISRDSGMPIYYNNKLYMGFHGSDGTNANFIYITGDFSSDWGQIATYSTCTIDSTIPYTSNNYLNSGIRRKMYLDNGTFTTLFQNGIDLTTTPWEQLVKRNYTLSYNGTAWSTTINNSVRRSRDIVYGTTQYIENRPLLFSTSYSYYTPYSNENISYTDLHVKSNIAGYEMLGVNTYVLPYSDDNNITYKSLRLIGLKSWADPDVVTTRALLPSPFTKTSDKTLRITYDINFE